VNTVWVNVEYLPQGEDPEKAAGLWEVSLLQDMPSGHAAGAARDVFHRRVALGVREDYEIRTLDPDTRVEILEADDYEEGSICDGDVEWIQDAAAAFEPSP
jgi:hypothetical protein